MPEYGMLVFLAEHTGGAPPHIENVGFFTDIGELCRAVLKAREDASPGWSVEMEPLAINHCRREEEKSSEREFRVGDNVQVVMCDDASCYVGRTGVVKEVENECKRIGVRLSDGAGHVVYFTRHEIELIPF